MRLTDLSLKLKIILGSCIPLILFTILAVIATISVKSLLQSSKWVNHTHSVIQQSMNIEAAAVDMETGMRGYLLAGFVWGKKFLFNYIRQLINRKPMVLIS